MPACRQPIRPSRKLARSLETLRLSSTLTKNAGAALLDIHVRNGHEASGGDPDKFARLQEGIRVHCRDMIIQFSTGERSRAREAMLYVKPEMASLATGLVNFPTILYESPPDFVRGRAVTMRAYAIKARIEVFGLQ